MTCLIKSLYKEEFDEYGKALGSESAAYYLLSMNNGYPVEYDPNGQESKLWKDILRAANNNRNSAILMKSYYYRKAYLDQNNWLEKYTSEPEYDPLISPTPNTVVRDILLNDEYDNIYRNVCANGVDDKQYAMYTALIRTKRDYIEKRIKDFIDDYRNGGSGRYNSLSFFDKVIRFYNSIFNKGKIQNPLNRTIKKTRDLAAKEFDETARWLVISSIKDRFDENDPIRTYLSRLYDEDDFDGIRNVIDLLDHVCSGVPYSFQSISSHSDEARKIGAKLQLLRVLNTLANIGSPIITDMYKQFGSVTSAVEAILNDDVSGLTDALISYRSSFLNSVDTALSNIRERINTDEIQDLVLLYSNLNPDLLSENEKVYDAMKNGIESRLVSLEKGSAGSFVDKQTGKVSSRTQGTKYELKIRLKNIKNLDPDNPEDLVKLVDIFMDAAEKELSSVLNYLKKYNHHSTSEKTGEQYHDPQVIMSALTLNYMRTDVIGYYSSIVQTYISSLSQKNGLNKLQIDNINARLQNSLSTLISLTEMEYNKALVEYTDKFAEQVIENEQTVGDKENAIRLFKLWLNNEINNGSLSYLATQIGVGTDATSNVVRVIQNLLNRDERRAYKATYNVKNDLITKYNKIPGILKHLGLNLCNPQKVIVELDRNGLPTGYFLRDVNYGAFYNDLMDEHNQLRKKYNEKLKGKYKLVADSRGGTVFDFDVAGVEEIWKDYMDDLDDWLDDHCNRRYTAEYYKARRRMLSRATLDRVEDIQEEIQLLIDKCTDINGYVYTFDLTPNEFDRLTLLQKDLDNLSSPYIALRDDSGKIIKFELKPEEEVDMAEELLKWNQFCNDGIKREADWDKYNAALSRISDPDKRAKFERDNTTVGFVDEFWAGISAGAVEQSDLYAYSKGALKKLIKLARENGNDIDPDLTIFGEDAIREIRRLEMDADKNRRTGGTAAADAIKKYAERVPVMMLDPEDPTQIITAVLYFTRLYPDNYLDIIYKTKRVYNKNTKTYTTKLVPLDIFYTLKPKDPSYIIRRPYGKYSKISGGRLVNKNYKTGNSEQYQPRFDKYENKQYTKLFKKDKDGKYVHKEVVDFYNAVIKYMRESYNKIPNGHKISEYQMPQRSAGYRDLIERRRVGRVFSNMLLINERDTDFNREDLPRLPDGTVVQTIPIRWISRGALGDPANIDCDVVGSVSDFFEMAENFKNKSVTVPKIELLISRMSGGMTTSSTSSSGADNTVFARKILEMYGYGKTQKGFGDENKRMTVLNRFLTKVANFIRTATNLALLGGKALVAWKGGTASEWQVISQALVGRQYGVHDLFWNAGYKLLSSPAAFVSLFMNRTVSKIQAAMEYNNLADAGENGKNVNKGRFINTMIALPMFWYRLVDYHTTSSVMMSTYHATRLIKSLDTGDWIFMNEDECIDMYLKHGKTEYQAHRVFDNATNRHLFKMYELEKGTRKFKLKDKFTFKYGGEKVTIIPSDYVTPQVEDRISGSTEHRASVINGVKNVHGKSPLEQNPLLRWAATMRGYLFSIGWDSWKNSSEQKDEMWHGQFNFETGHIEHGAAKAFLRNFTPKDLLYMVNDTLVELATFRRMGMFGWSYNRKVSRSELQAARLFLLNIVGFLVFGYLTVCVLLSVVKNAPEDWLSWAMLQVILTSMIEEATPFSMETVTELMNSATVVQRYVTTFKVFLNYIMYFMGLDESFDPNKIQTSGAYTNKPQWFKDLLENPITMPLGISGAYRTYTPYIPGVDVDKPSNKLMRQYQDTLKNMSYEDVLSPEGIGTIMKAYTSPIGPKSTINFYRKIIKNVPVIGPYVENLIKKTFDEIPKPKESRKLKKPTRFRGSQRRRRSVRKSSKKD